MKLKVVFRYSGEEKEEFLSITFVSSIHIPDFPKRSENNKVHGWNDVTSIRATAVQSWGRVDAGIVGLPVNAVVINDWLVHTVLNCR